MNRFGSGVAGNWIDRHFDHRWMGAGQLPIAAFHARQLNLGRTEFGLDDTRTGTSRRDAIHGPELPDFNPRTK
jgi:hypothetical protein